MYLDSNDKKENKLSIRVSNNQKLMIKKYMSMYKIKSMSDFINVCIDNKLKKENTLISM